MGVAPYPKLQAKKPVQLSFLPITLYYTGNCILILFYFVSLLSSLHYSPKAFYPVVAQVTQEQDILSSPSVPWYKMKFGLLSMMTIKYIQDKINNLSISYTEKNQ